MREDSGREGSVDIGGSGDEGVSMSEARTIEAVQPAERSAFISQSSDEDYIFTSFLSVPAQETQRNDSLVDQNWVFPTPPHLLTDSFNNLLLLQHRFFRSFDVFVW